MSAIPLDVLISVFDLIIGILLQLIFSKLWPDDIPRKVEDFNDDYEEKIERILSNNLNKSSILLEKIVSNNIKLDDESKSGEYSVLLKKHEELFNNIRIYGEIKNRHKEVEMAYSILNNLFKHLRLLTFFLFLSIILYIIKWYYNLSGDMNSFIVCGIFTITFYSIFRIISLYLEFNKNINIVLEFKKWILNEIKNVPKLSDIDEN